MPCLLSYSNWLACVVVLFPTETKTVIVEGISLIRGSGSSMNKSFLLKSAKVVEEIAGEWKEIRKEWKRAGGLAMWTTEIVASVSFSCLVQA